jgi:hypothetical protein
MSGIGRLAGSPVISIAGLALLPGLAGLLPGAGTSAGTSEAGRAVPSPGVSSSLQGVACTSASNCWAVGSYDTRTAQLNEVLHWNGTSWSRVTTPNHGAGAGHHSSLTAVACTSARNCWAVGSYVHGTIQLNEALYWDGATWSMVNTPDPGIAGTGAHSLSGVSCVSRTDCWAVGRHITDRGISRNAALHWNGAGWSAVSIPEAGQNIPGGGRELSAVACTAAHSCWAVGGYFGEASSAEQTEALRWNGAQWLPAAAGNDGSVSSVACTSAASCWAVLGQASDNGAIRWNGTRWSAVATPGGAELNGVACSSAARCMTVGTSTSPVAVLNAALTWNGTAWSAVAVPDPGGTGAGAQNRLASVACTSAAKCWAVGSYWDRSVGAHRNVILHWNGHTWSG